MNRVESSCSPPRCGFSPFHMGTRPRAARLRASCPRPLVKKRVQVCRGVTKDDEFEPAASSAVLRDCALIFTDQDFFPLTVTECFANQYCPCFPLRGLTCRCCSAAFSELITTSNGSFRRCKGQHCIFTASLIIWRCRHMKHTTR